MDQEAVENKGSGSMIEQQHKWATADRENGKQSARVECKGRKMDDTRVKNVAM